MSTRFSFTGNEVWTIADTCTSCDAFGNATFNTSNYITNNVSLGSGLTGYSYSQVDVCLSLAATADFNLTNMCTLPGGALNVVAGGSPAGNGFYDSGVIGLGPNSPVWQQSMTNIKALQVQNLTDWSWSGVVVTPKPMLLTTNGPIPPNPLFTL